MTCALHVVDVCFQANFAKQFVPEITDYSCRIYVEFVFFWSLLGKVKKLSDLPEIDAWSDYTANRSLFGRSCLMWTVLGPSYLRDCFGW